MEPWKRWVFNSEGEGTTILRNVGKYLPTNISNIKETWIFNICYLQYLEQQSEYLF